MARIISCREYRTKTRCGSSNVKLFHQSEMAEMADEDKEAITKEDLWSALIIK